MEDDLVVALAGGDHREHTLFGGGAAALGLPERVAFAPDDGGLASLEGRAGEEGVHRVRARATLPTADGEPRTIEVESIDRSGGDRRVEATLAPVRSLSRSFDVAPTGEIVWIQARSGDAELWLTEELVEERPEP